MSAIWKQGYAFLNIGFFLWFATLAIWLADFTLWAYATGFLTCFSFMLHGIYRGIFTMFGKNNSPQIPASAPLIQNNYEQDIEKQHKTTVISSEVRFDGNLTASGYVYIYGQVYGNIVCNEGLVKVAHNSSVSGNITCDQLIIDGLVKGECKSSAIDIDEHGNVDGTVSYVTFAVRKGGVFTGKAEVLNKREAEANVISMAAGAVVEGNNGMGGSTDIEGKKASSSKPFSGKQKN